jgi:hypothetical protein
MINGKNVHPASTKSFLATSVVGNFENIGEKSCH